MKEGDINHVYHQLSCPASHGAGDERKVVDVARYAEQFKRLGERLHPYETRHLSYQGARTVFDAARGERVVRSLAARAELALAAEDYPGASQVLAAAPGMLLRSLDRLLRGANDSDHDAILEAVEGVLGQVSGRVLCSVREHFANRARNGAARVFTTRNRRAWVTSDTRAPLPTALIGRVAELLDGELGTRLPYCAPWVIDPDVLEVALPLSGMASQDGFAVLPRGSRSRVDGEVLRFFTYWRQTDQRTDFDLSAMLLDAEFHYVGHVSWTNYHDDGAVYSGDITDAPDGATEFIDIPLDTLGASYVVPQVNVYSGEGFDQVQESMFGWMTRDRKQAGAPFEPRTVRARSEMRGAGRVALPVVFSRGEEGSWTATWTHLYLAGSPHFNQIETNQVSTSLLVRAILERDYLTVGHVIGMHRDQGHSVTAWDPAVVYDEPVTFVGLHQPQGLPEGSEVITLDRLNQLIPR